MENELTPRVVRPYPVIRNTADFKRNLQDLLMDEDAEIKEPKLDATVGKPVEDASTKDNEDEKKAKFVRATRSQQEKAQKAWDEENKKLESRGQRVPEEVRKMQRGFIEQGIEPRHIIGGASDGRAFADFNSNKYQGTQLAELANRLKELGRNEEITQEKINEIKDQANVLVRLGLSEDLHRQFIDDINRAQEESNPKEQGSGTAEKEIADTDFRQYFIEVADLAPDNPDNSNILGDIAANGRQLIDTFDDGAERNNRRKQFQAILSNTDIDQKREQLKQFLRDADKKRTENLAKGKIEVPHEVTSVQGLAKFIMGRQGNEVYGYEGKYPLLRRNPETGKEEFSQANFLIWVREQIIQLHDDNRTSEMSPLQAVAIETQFKTFTIYNMNRFRGQYFKDENSGEILNDLADTAVNMCYLFGFFRNMDLAYRQQMNSDEELPKIITGIHAKNDVTHADNWAQFLSMPDKFGENVKDENGNPVAGVKDTKVGDAELIANDIYYNLSDIDEIKDIVGTNKTFMTKDGFKKTLHLEQILANNDVHEWDDLQEQEGLYDKVNDNFYFIDTETKERKYIFNSDGSINKRNYFDFINFYNKPTPDKTVLDFVRDLTRITIAEKVGIESGVSKDATDLARVKSHYDQLVREKGKDQADKIYKREVGVARINTRFAEYSAFAQQRPLMIAARNDVNRRGYDASTKLDINYILRQSGEGTAGPIGNTEFLKHQIIKNFSVDFVAGLKTENKKSPYEIFREIRRVMNDSSKSVEQKEKEKANLLGQLRFQDNAALDYSSNQVNRAYQIFHAVTGAQELNLDKIVTRSFLEGIKYNQAEFEKQIKDDFIKPLRYAFASNSALKYGGLLRGFERLDPETGLPIYKEKTLAEHMFGDDVLDDIKDEAIKGSLTIANVNKDSKQMTPYERFREYLDTNEARTRIVKNVARAQIAAELRKHRDRRGPAARWNADMINKFILALESIRAYEKDKDGNIVETDRRFFSEKDISWIRQNSNTGYKSMYSKEMGASALKGFAVGLGGGIKSFFQDVFKG